jgi:hypothetical protein
MTNIKFNKGFSRKKYRLIAFIMVGMLLVTFEYSCKKLIEVDAPVTSTNASNVYSNDATAIAVLTGIYSSLSQGKFITGSSGLSLYAGLSADEFTLFSGITDVTRISYFKNSLSVNTGGYEYWVTLYPFIFKCNSAIEGLSQTSSLSPAVQKQLIGEAKFMRAFFYFYLVNLYGPVPLAVSTNYNINQNSYRSPVAEVYNKIVEDLTEAKELLSTTFLDGTLLKVSAERVRPTKWAAAALLARVYLYYNDYEKAELESTSVIDQFSFFELSTLNNAFLKASLGNKEAIWQLQPVNLGRNTEDGWMFVINAALGTNKPVYLNSALIGAFELGDSRKSSWVKDTIISGKTYSYPYKYKSAKLNNPVTEYLMIIRLAEQFLIRAEARIHLANIEGAKKDINVIRRRANLPDILTNDNMQLMEIVMHEKQIELFTELGHRWLDLKRSKAVDLVMSKVTPLKGGTWQNDWQWYPLPAYDLQLNQNLEQNQGY